MKTLLVYYSMSGNTRKAALARFQQLEEGSADILELKYRKPMTKFGAYFNGCFDAMRAKKAKLEDITVDIASYDQVIIAMPIWAGRPAPPMNNILELIPEGKEIELIFTSSSGNTKRAVQDIVARLAKIDNNVVHIASYKRADLQNDIFEPSVEDIIPTELQQQLHKGGKTKA